MQQNINIRKITGKGWARMKKSKFWKICDYCGTSDIENWESHIKECPKIPHKHKEVILKIGKDTSKTNFDDFPTEVKSILETFIKPKRTIKLLYRIKNLFSRTQKEK